MVVENYNNLIKFPEECIFYVKNTGPKSDLPDYLYEHHWKSSLLDGLILHNILYKISSYNSEDNFFTKDGFIVGKLYGSSQSEIGLIIGRKLLHDILKLPPS